MSCSSVVLVWNFNTRGVYDFISKQANIPGYLVPLFNGLSYLFCRFLKSGVTNELKRLLLLRQTAVLNIFAVIYGCRSIYLSDFWFTRFFIAILKRLVKHIENNKLSVERAKRTAGGVLSSVPCNYTKIQNYKYRLKYHSKVI